MRSCDPNRPAKTAKRKENTMGKNKMCIRDSPCRCDSGGGVFVCASNKIYGKNVFSGFACFL